MSESAQVAIEEHPASLIPVWLLAFQALASRPSQSVPSY